jgi:predicted ATP-grasp superfamily ATP-dependent carboligase
VIKNDTPYVIEVNPRFQGTLECVERILDVNLVEMHIKACLHGSLPKQLNEPKSTCTRLILYAPEHIHTPDIKPSNEIRDVPFPNSSIEAGEPLCSVIIEGRDRETSLGKALDKADSIYKTLVN